MKFNTYTKTEMVNKILRETNITEKEIKRFLKVIRSGYEPKVILKTYAKQGLYGLNKLYWRCKKYYGDMD